jgi:murein DD-endopeptidase MepM/ murein hydrolase activator NlpD
VDRDGHVTVLLVTDASDEPRSVRVSLRRLRWIASGLAVLVLLLCVMIGSWWYLVGRARQADLLEAQVAQLLEREARLEDLARTLDEVEAAYERVRTLFGPGSRTGLPGDLWLPPPTGARPLGSEGRPPGAEALPESWPLTERGFVTQILLEASGTEHPGIDIAVPAGSYVRAAGEGTVLEAGEDPVYGIFLVLDHGEEYRSLYAHASLLLVTVGDRVRRDEVIALTGSSGRSTAPHLHFEIRRDGEPVDPLTMVTQP